MRNLGLLGTLEELEVKRNWTLLGHGKCQDYDKEERILYLMMEKKYPV